MRIIGEYDREQYTGGSDPDAFIPAMLAGMKEVRLDKVIAEVQRQLDAFVESKG